MRRVILYVSALLFAVAAPVGLKAQARSDYKIAPNDVIVIDVFGEKDFSREFRVSQSGTINYYFLKEVRVAGKTTSEMREMLTVLLDKDYLVDPQVAVDVKVYGDREVFVQGAVNKPGAVPITGEQDLTIVQAIARAGGFTSKANQNKIEFSRPGQAKKAFSFNELLKDSKNMVLQPGDVIEIVEKLF